MYIEWIYIISMFTQAYIYCTLIHTYPSTNYSWISMEQCLGQWHQGHQWGIEYSHNSNNSFTYWIFISIFDTLSINYIYIYIYIYTYPLVCILLLIAVAAEDPHIHVAPDTTIPSNRSNLYTLVAINTPAPSTIYIVNKY